MNAMNVGTCQVSDEVVKRIAAEAATAAVDELFVRMGLDVDQPIELQRDFTWVRQRRKLETRVGMMTISAIIGAMVLGVGSAVWMGIKALILIK